MFHSTWSLLLLLLLLLGMKQSTADYPSASPPLHPSHSANPADCPTCPFTNSINGPYPPPINAPLYPPVHRGEYFDVYGHWIENRYSEVFWTAQPAVPLPAAVVAQFKNRAIAFTGFEVDVVAGGLTSEAPEYSIPEFQVYNHHYCATITGASSKMVKIGSRGQDTLLRDDNRIGRRGFEVHPPEWEPRDIGTFINSTVPTAQNFWQGNGGEHRKAFKHLPRGTGQLIMSPEQFILQPMLINTNYQGDPNSTHDQNKTARQLFHEAPMPKESLSLPFANYSGLMECPCTTRTIKILTGFETKATGTCMSNTSVSTGEECFDAIASLVTSVVANVTEKITSAPSGCYILANAQGNEAHYNAQSTSTAVCGSTSGRPVRAMGTADSASHNFKIDLVVDGGTGNVTITLQGPSDVWFGVGFNASTMSDLPYTITVEENVITERKLGNHMPGSPLVSSIAVLSNTVAPGTRAKPAAMNRKGGVPLGTDVGVSNWLQCRGLCDSLRDTKDQQSQQCGSWTYLPEHFTTPYNIEQGTCRLYQLDQDEVAENNDMYTSKGWVEGMYSGVAEEINQVRTVVMTRALVGLTKNHYTFDPTVSAVPFIEAVGTTSTFQYHGKSKGGNTLILVEVGAPVCVCKGKTLSGSINGIPWSDNCHDWPDTTIKRDHNPSCSIETYGGGMICCHHEIYLLDKDQVIPPQTFKFRMKYRFWYEDPQDLKGDDGVGASMDAPSSSISSQVWGPDLPYQNAFFMFRETEIAHGEYDVPQCQPGTLPQDCVHVVIGNFQMIDAMHDCVGRSDVWCSPVALPNLTYPQSQHVALVHMSPHCHGPACISMEMIDTDNNVTICKTQPFYGTTDQAMNEAGYAAGIPPCMWGTKEEGLPYPPVLALNANITVIKKCNSTVGHRGVMGHWQMRAIWAKDPTTQM